MSQSEVQSLDARLCRLVKIVRAINALYECETGAQLNRFQQRLDDIVNPPDEGVVFPLTEKNKGK